MPQPFVPRPIPRGADPRVKRLFEEMLAQKMPAQRLGKLAGISDKTIRDWQTKTPSVANLEACLNVLGLTLAVVPLEPTSKP